MNLPENNILGCFDPHGDFRAAKYYTYLNDKPPYKIRLYIYLDLEKVLLRMKSRYPVSADDIYLGRGLEYHEMKSKPKEMLDYIWYPIKTDFCLWVNNGDSSIYHSGKIKQEEIDELIKIIEECRANMKPKDAVFYMVKDSAFHGFELNAFKIKTPAICIEENYNDDFLPINKKVIDFVNDDNKSGIVLFHGKFGTGKTTYLRHVITQTKKKVIYLPVSVFERIEDPNFLRFLVNHTGSIWLIEDCENLVASRENGKRSGSISALLNLGDGLLADALNIQVICTFNTELKNIDNALLRKGRLITRYEFAPLAIEKTKHLLKKNGIDYTKNEPLTLAQIYNYIDDNNSVLPEKIKLGFKQNNHEQNEIQQGSVN